MFNKKFEVIEILESVTITHYLDGKSKDVKKDIEQFKSNGKRYQLVGKNGMIVWA